MINAMGEEKYFIGSQVDKFKGVLKLNYPIEHGIVKDWEEMEAIWRYIFDELKVNPKEHRVLLTEPPGNPFYNKKKMAEIFYDKFGVPYLYFQN